jgi:DNA repair exonuclease SbcCD nuclease subunit
MEATLMPFKFCHSGDLHLEEDRYFGDTAQCIEWFVEDGIRQGTNLFVLNGDLTTYKQTIRERKFWVDAIIRMAHHAPVLLIAGNHGKELENDLYPLAKVKGKLPVFLCTGPEFIELDGASIAVFPYPRKEEFAGAGEKGSLAQAFIEKLKEFNQQFERRQNSFRLFFGHFGVAGARVSSGQPLVGRCAEYPLEPLLNLRAQYVGLSHIHLRQQLGPRVWYSGSLSRCDYSEIEDKGYNFVTLTSAGLLPDVSDLDVQFRMSPTRPMIELHAVYEDGELRLPEDLDLGTLKDSRVKVTVQAPNGPERFLSHEQQENLKERLLAASPAELKVKIERDADAPIAPAPIAVARSAEEKLRAYWTMKGGPAADRQERLLAKLASLETSVHYDPERR